MRTFATIGTIITVLAQACVANGPGNGTPPVDTGVPTDTDVTDTDTGDTDTDSPTDTGTTDTGTTSPCTTDCALTVGMTGPTGPIFGYTTTVKGADNVNFLELEFTPHTDDAVLNRLTLTIEGDDAGGRPTTSNINVRDHIASCVLMDDLGLLLSGPEPADTNGVVEFDNIAYFMSAESISRVIVECDITTIDVESGNQDSYHMHLTGADIEAEYATNGDLILENDIGLPYGNPNEGADYWVQVESHGELTVAFNGPPPLNMLPGTYNFPMLDLSFIDSLEEMSVQELELQFTGDLRVIDQVRLWYVDSLGYSHHDFLAMQPTGEATFTNIDIAVPSGANDVMVHINVSASAQPGESVSATLVMNGLEVVGLTSGEVLDPANDFTPTSNIVGNEMTVP